MRQQQLRVGRKLETAGTASSGSASSASTGVVISTLKGPDGTYLTDASGRALYLWLGDSTDKSNCMGICAMTWPPLITTTRPTASGGVTAADLGTITRSDGRKQATYDGHPLYYLTLDSGPDMTNGQGSDNFGARWWLVAPSGAAITLGGASTGAPMGAY